MFPVELLGRLVELVLGDVAKDVLRKGQDPKRRFAREVFGYYEVLKDYRRLSQDFISLLDREKQLVPSGRMTPGTARRLQEVADQMTKDVETLVGTFEGDLRDTSLGRESSDSSDSARKRFSVVEIYDKQLSELMSSANRIDCRVCDLAKQMSAVWVDWDRQQITFLDPSTEGVAVYIEGVGLKLHGGLFGKRGLEQTTDQASGGFKTIEFTKADDRALLIEALTRNLSVVDDALTAIATFLRANFKVEDLL